MIAKKYKSELVSISNQLKGIYTLTFKSLGRPYKFLPGQFLHIALDECYDGTGQWPDSRCFSIQSSPNEENIKITYTVKGEYTKFMEQQLKIGSLVWLKLPYGDLFQHSNSKQRTVFIAGGTGITPFLSLFTHESFSEYIHPKIYLGFRSEGFNIYENELKRTRNSHIFLKYYYEDKDGVINIERIFIENGFESVYFISGPPLMIKTFKKSLIEKGVKDVNIITDDWV